MSAGLRSAAILVAVVAPVVVTAAQEDASVEARLRALEQKTQKLEQDLRDRDALIQQLLSERPGTEPAAVVAPAQEPPAVQSIAALEKSGASAAPMEDAWGSYEGGKGLVLTRSSLGELDWAVFSYVRYLNQGGFDDSYTDSFGRTRPLDLRNDVQLQKITMNFKGWLFDPDFRYLFYAWTSNTNQGLGAQVVLGGFLSYRFNDAISVAAGIGSLPSTRSTNWTFPNWLKIDNRTMADEYFRGSYTSGIWAWGDIADGLKYRVMFGNNLSQLGVDAIQLDNEFNTVSGALWWMPTTGEYGPAEGFGDFEVHEDLATLFGVNFTRSREDAQSQPGVNSFENAQIRLSDGTLIFQSNPFNNGTDISKATYNMISANAGMKYRGFSLDGEVYWRRVDDFLADGPLPRSRLSDTGFQLQASAMLIPQELQAYVSGSKIYGQYGDPWDAALGASWYPLKRRELKINSQYLYMSRSPVGYSSVPYLVGGNGWAFTTDFVLAF